MSEEVVQQIKERMSMDRVFRHDLFASPLHILQEYPLTEEEKHLFVVPNFSRMIENRLAGVSYPCSEDAIVLLQELGVQALLGLSEETVSEDLLRYKPLCLHRIPKGPRPRYRSWMNGWLVCAQKSTRLLDAGLPSVAKRDRWSLLR